jgi:2-amino-4-hydroxy-6-hydroxymethyldihydropteridine diphosphokinase
MTAAPSVIAYIALGANLGDRRACINAALRWLNDTPGIRVTKASSLLDNPAVGGPPGSPPFLNAVAEIETTLPPHELLDVLLDAEIHLGRERREKWGPRVIDLDIILYGDRIIDEEGLKIPHPLMHRRTFVLIPLAQLVPQLKHPISGISIIELLQNLNS